MLIFLLSLLPSPPTKTTEAFESLDWLVAKRRPGIRFFGLGILGCRVGQDETSKMSILDTLVASCLGCTIPNSDLFIVLFSNIFPENIGISQEFYRIINAYPLTWRLGYGSTTLYQQLRHNLLTFLRTTRCVAKALQKRISDAVKAWGDVAWIVQDVTMKSGCFSLQVFCAFRSTVFCFHININTMYWSIMIILPHTT